MVVTLHTHPVSSAPVIHPQAIRLSWRKKLCFALIVFITFLLLAELALRVFAVLSNRPRLYRLDPVAGYTCKPSLNHMLKRYGDQAYYYSTDAHGFRLTAPKDATRAGASIVILGDSFTFGYCVNDEDSVGYLLSENTGRPVVSLSAAGYSPDIELALLRTYLQDADRKTSVGHIVVLICDNDFKGVTYRYYFHRPKAHFEATGATYRERPPYLGYLDHLMDWSYLAYTILTRIGPGRQTTNVPYEESPRLLAHVIHEIHTLCQSHGLPATFLFVEHLDKPQVSKNMRDEFVDTCKQQGIEVRVITQDILANVEDYRTLLTTDDWHWNRQGAEKVSAIIQRSLH